MELYVERGYEQTTVAEIASRAGLTERTFFRYFADKREVLFSGAQMLLVLVFCAVIGAPESAEPIEAIAAGLGAAATLLQDHRGRDLARYRNSIVSANPELRERELIKMAKLGSGVADALRQRGVPEPAASLAAQAGIAIFHVAFGRWIDEAEHRDLSELMRDSLDELSAILATGKAPAQRSPANV